MVTPAELPGLTSEHEFFSPIDDNFERDMEEVFANATRGQIESPSQWPMGPYHAMEFYPAKSGVPQLPMDQALRNPDGPWGGIKGSVQWRAERRGLRGLGQSDEGYGSKGMLLLGGGLLAGWMIWAFLKNRDSNFVP